MSVEIKYKGNTIASANTEITKTIKTSGQYCEADIEVINTPDGGDAPVINPLSVTANGTYNAPSGVDGYSPVTVNVPQGITPTGNINITDTSETDVTNYATAQVVDADLIASNIKKDVNILGIIGTFEGGGGGSLPSSISKLDGGSFTVASDTDARNYSISHNLGENPKGFVIWTDDLAYGTAESRIMIVNAMYKTVAFSATAVAAYVLTRKTTAGTFGQYQNTVAASAESSWLSSTIFKIGIESYYKAGITYKWIAWA